MADNEMSNDAPNQTASHLPPGFAIYEPGCHVGSSGYLVVNENSLVEHASKWTTKEEAIGAAWRWWSVNGGDFL